MARTSAISEEVWANAIRAVMVDKMSLRTAAQKFGVHHMSLHRRIKDLRGDKKPSDKTTSIRSSYQPPSGMSMVNMMHMNMENNNPILKPQSTTFRIPSGIVPSSNHTMIRSSYSGLENASSNVSNWTKAIQSIETGHFDIIQAANTFKLDPHLLHEHMSKRTGDEYLRPGDEHGILKVIVARAELGVKMNYDEVVDLLRRVVYKYNSPLNSSSNEFKQLVHLFVKRNEQFLRSTLDGMNNEPTMSPSSHEYAYRYPQTASSHHHHASMHSQQLRPVMASEHKYQDNIPEEKPPGHRGYDTQARTYSPSSNLLIASNKINVEKNEMYPSPAIPIQRREPNETKSKEDNDVVEV